MDLIAPLSSAVMAIVWVVYFQLFFIQYKRSSRPYLVIHHAQNENPDALCLLVNMGKEPVHIQCVQAVVQDSNGTERILTVTEYERVSASDDNIQQSLRQGPLQPGGYLVLGSFRDIVLGCKSEDEETRFVLEEVSQFVLRAAAIHGPSKDPVGVRRRFVLRHEGGTSIYPLNIYSEQLVKRRDKNTVRTWVEQELDPQRRGSSESERSDQSREQAEEKDA